MPRTPLGRHSVRECCGNTENMSKDPNFSGPVMGQLTRNCSCVWGPGICAHALSMYLEQVLQKARPWVR